MRINARHILSRQCCDLLILFKGGASSFHSCDEFTRIEVVRSDHITL